MCDLCRAAVQADPVPSTPKEVRETPRTSTVPENMPTLQPYADTGHHAVHAYILC